MYSSCLLQRLDLQLLVSNYLAALQSFKIPQRSKGSKPFANFNLISECVLLSQNFANPHRCVPKLEHTISRTEQAYIFFMGEVKINSWISGGKKHLRTSTFFPTSDRVPLGQPWSILFASAEIGQVALVLHLAKDTEALGRTNYGLSQKESSPKSIHSLVTSLCCNPFLDKTR